MTDTARAPIGVQSGTVMTVLGPIPAERMGVTLMHEHILLDASKLWQCPCKASEMAIAEAPVSIENIGELRMNPFVSRDNCFLLDVDLAAGELGRYSELGGDTVVDPTNFGIGRDPEALQRIARRTRLNIVMGSGFYLEPSHPDWFTRMDLDEATAFIVDDVGGGPTSPPSWRASSARSASRSSSRRRRRSRFAPRPVPRASPACRCRSTCPVGSASPIGCSTSWNRRAPTSATPCSAT